MQVRSYSSLNSALQQLTPAQLQHGVFIYADFENISHLHLDSLHHPTLGWVLALRSIKVHTPEKGTASLILRQLQMAPVPHIIDDIVNPQFDRRLERLGYLPCPYIPVGTNDVALHARYWPGSSLFQ